MVCPSPKMHHSNAWGVSRLSRDGREPKKEPVRDQRVLRNLHAREPAALNAVIVLVSNWGDCADPQVPFLRRRNRRPGISPQVAKSAHD